MGILGWIVIGGLAGWLASILTRTNKRLGLLANIAIGIVGGIVGGIIFQAAGSRGVVDFSWWSLFVALVGSVILLFAYRLIAGKR